MALGGITQEEVLTAVDTYTPDAARKVLGADPGGRVKSVTLPSGRVAYCDPVALVFIANAQKGGVPLSGVDTDPRIVSGHLRDLGFGVDGIGGPIERAIMRGGIPESRYDGPRPLVWIAPCYGNPKSRKRFAETLATEVSFMQAPLLESLDQRDMEALRVLHSGGEAKFWGATGRHTDQMRRLQQGDHVIFVGSKYVRALGRIGHVFQNYDFASRLWPPDEDRVGWLNVYSVVDFRSTYLPYQSLWQYTGSRIGDNFQRARLLEGERAEAVITGLGLDEPVERVSFQELRRIEKSLSDSGGSEVAQGEAGALDGTSYERFGGSVTVDYLEKKLVRRFRASLGVADNGFALRVSTGNTDIYLPENREIVEAKSSSAHYFVRQALGQLLSYALAANEPVEKVSGLFPEKPHDRDIRLLTTYGVDCIYWNGISFTRISGSERRRLQLLEIWKARL